MHSLTGLVAVVAAASCYLYLLSSHLPAVSHTHPDDTDTADPGPGVKEYR